MINSCVQPERNPMKLLFVILPFLFLINCSSSLLIKLPENERNIKSYSLNKVDSISVGESLLTYGKMKFIKSYEAVDYFNSIIFKGVTISKGDIWYSHYSLQPDGGFVIEKPDYPAAIHINSDGVVNRGWFNLSTKDDYPASPDVWPQTPLFKQSKDFPTDNSFYSELIYCGINNRTVNCVYREYANDLLRSSFSQRIYYALDQDSTFSFKGIVFKVSRVDNRGITYKVLSDNHLDRANAFSR